MKPPKKCGKKLPPKKKFDFKVYKKNTINSLNEVECFLNNFKKFQDMLDSIKSLNNYLIIINRYNFLILIISIYILFLFCYFSTIYISLNSSLVFPSIKIFTWLTSVN